MINDVKEIIYIKKMMPLSSEYFKLEINDDKNLVKYMNNKNFTKGPNINTVSSEIVIKFLDLFFRTIDSWKEEYIDNSAVDGIEWDLKIIYKNGHEEYYCGKNDFPDNYEILDKLIEKMINKDVEE